MLTCPDGTTITPSTINPNNMSRSDAMAGYIKHLPPRANLVILTNQQVTEVVFNGTTDANNNIIASGVRFQANAGATAYSVQANKEVILAYVLIYFCPPAATWQTALIRWRGMGAVGWRQAVVGE